MQLEPHNPRRALSPPDEACILLYHYTTVQLKQPGLQALFGGGKEANRANRQYINQRFPLEERFPNLPA